MGRGSGVRTRACVYRSEDNLQAYNLSFHHVSPRDLTQVIMVGSKLHYLLPSLKQLRTYCFSADTVLESRNV